MGQAWIVQARFHSGSALEGREAVHQGTRGQSKSCRNMVPRTVWEIAEPGSEGKYVCHHCVEVKLEGELIAIGLACFPAL
jgi:hypothetical protein